MDTDTEPSQLLEKLTGRELSILQDYVELWTASLLELLQNLKETCPESSTIVAEIYYWRDITRVLDAVTQELK